MREAPRFSLMLFFFPGRGVGYMDVNYFILYTFVYFKLKITPADYRRLEVTEGHLEGNHPPA